MTMQNMAEVADHQVDLEADFANEDETVTSGSGSTRHASLSGSCPAPF